MSEKFKPNFKFSTSPTHNVPNNLPENIKKRLESLSSTIEKINNGEIKLSDEKKAIIKELDIQDAFDSLKYNIDNYSMDDDSDENINNAFAILEKNGLNELNSIKFKEILERYKKIKSGLEAKIYEEFKALDTERNEYIKIQIDNINNILQMRHHNYRSLSDVLNLARKEIKQLEKELSDKEKESENFVSLMELYERVIDEFDSTDLIGRPRDQYKE